MIRAIYEALYRPDRPVFSLQEVLSFLEQFPEVGKANERWLGTSWHQHHADKIHNRSALGAG